MNIVILGRRRVRIKQCGLTVRCLTLHTFRSLWGLQHLTPQQRLGAVAAAGFNGVEASLADLQAIDPCAEHLTRTLRDHSLSSIIGIYTSNIDYEAYRGRESIDAHVNTFRSQLRCAIEYSPTHINVHAGQDCWSLQQSLEFYARILPIQESVAKGVTVSYETHRGRSLYHPTIAAELLRHIPSLMITLDASHWLLVCERILNHNDDRNDLKLAVTRTQHVHARIGTAQSPQVDDPSRITDEHTFYHSIWRDVWMHQRLQGHSITTLCPEYGPAPYSRLSDRDTEQLVNRERQRLTQLFEHCEMSEYDK